MRVGFGYDVHVLVESRPLVLGGVTVPFHLGLDGHSDADVVVHAIMDALLGAAALGDIGIHFPPGDPAYKDASSIGLLVRVRDLLAAQGYEPGNVDAVIVAQQPKLSPYFFEMRRRIGEALAIGVDRVSVKATTSEGLGFVGRGEGMVAQAVATIVRLGSEIG
ncbi:MAG: 2-C-methyl-D-erythritol 2,4-cyclodiphosphate synthase [Dehalococcoidia bacterium]|nr:2-C-methyl-D-erythritol 2,4-cyclodiphosphate synthase [Dehalococcoidia bacterium]